MAYSMRTVAARFVFSIVGLALIALVSAPAADACSCQPRTFCEHYAGADVVLQVRVVKERELAGMRVYGARVRSALKGDVGRTVTLVTPLSTAACGLSLPVGGRPEPVLLGGRYVNVEGLGRVIEVNACDFIQRDRVSRDMAVFARRDADSECPVCTSDAECGDGLYCSENGLCTRQCHSDVHCRDGGVCLDGRCVPGCNSDADCDDGWCGPVRDDASFMCRSFRAEGDRCNIGSALSDAAPCAPGLVCACADAGQVDENGDEIECDAVCHRVPAPNLCSLPAESGPCLAAFRRWYFDADAQSCRPFTWGGCGGNDNNFESPQLCREACGGATPCEDIRCQPHQRCALFDDHGQRPTPYCLDTCDDFPCPSGTTCQLSDVVCFREPCPPIARCVPNPEACQQPVEVGPCEAAIPRWYFDTQTGRCEEFRYGGCGGNDNNFPTPEECRDACAEGEPDPCDLILCVPGSECRVHRDAEGGVVPYCAEVCHPERCPEGSVCELVNVRCEDEPCPPVARCKEERDICSLPPETGPCRALIPRWFFNADSGRCEEFAYGGCQGNSNNFQTAEACAEACPGEPCDCPKIFAPVCGINGETYDNECEAHCRSVEIAHDGPCRDGCVCPDVYDPVCGADGRTYPNECRAHCADVPVVDDGECRCEPCLCPDVVDPVCGADNKTYGNACEARCAGVDVTHEGECGSACECSADCPGDAVCREGTCGPSCSVACLVADPVCGSDGNTYRCGAADAACHGTVVLHEGECGLKCTADEPCPGDLACRPVEECSDECGCASFCEPCDCPDVVAPVCGGDGVTYGNACEARCAGVDTAHEGECRDCSCNSDCSGNAICRQGKCSPACSVACLVEDPVCGSDGNTYVCGSVDAACHGVSVLHQGPCQTSCSPDEACADGVVCVPFNECQDPCGCASFCDACVCLDIYDPVCGADGQTYGNACEARCARVEVEHEGECGGCECPADVYDPVCGVDGATYGNACEARCAGVEIEYEGECRTFECRCNADCRDGDVCRDGACSPRCAFDCLIADPVCGVDGQTYACGEEDATCNGVLVLHHGPCRPTCSSDQPCVDGAPCRAPANCPDRCGCASFCDGECKCSDVEIDPVCGADGVTYDHDCAAGCAGARVVKMGRCGDCECPQVFEPVCGVDGVIYENRCRADCAGVDVVTDERCAN